VLFEQNLTIINFLTKTRW